MRQVADAYRVTIRVETLREYEALLPTGPRHALAADALAAFAPTHLDWLIELEIAERRPRRVRGWAAGPRLGWTSWLGSRAASAGGHRAETRLTRRAHDRHDRGGVGIMAMRSVGAVRASQRAGAEGDRDGDRLLQDAGNPYVELVHWLHVLLQDPRNDLASRSAARSTWSTRSSRATWWRSSTNCRAAHRDQRFQPQIEEAIEKGWLYASLQFSASRVRTGHLLRHVADADAPKCAVPQISSSSPQGRRRPGRRGVRGNRAILRRADAARRGARGGRRRAGDEDGDVVAAEAAGRGGAGAAGST
ncbi:type VI secretion system baseplate subunit TssG [Sphingomonas sp. MMS24-JH45]